MRRPQPRPYALHMRAACVLASHRPAHPGDERHSETSSERGSGELLTHDLADRRAVRPARDLRHHVRHHPAEVPHARRADLGDRAVDDLLELLLGELLRHELLQDDELALLGLGLLLTPPRAERLRRLDPPLALTLEHL